MRNNTKLSNQVVRFQTKGSADGSFAGQSLRMGYDLVTPGCKAEDIQSSITLRGNEAVVTITAMNRPRPPFDLEGKVDKFGFNKIKKPLTFDLAFDAEKYDLSSLKISCHNGVTRVFAVVPDAVDYLVLTETGWILDDPEITIEGPDALDLD